MNFLDATIVEMEGKAVVKGAGFQVVLPDEIGKIALSRARDQQVIYGIRPEHAHLDPAGSIEAEVYLIEPLGREDLIDVRLSDGSVVGVLEPAGQPVRVGERVRIRFEEEHSQLFDPQTEQSVLW